MIRPRVGAAAAVLLLLPLLAGCGSTSYCDQVKGDQVTLGAIVQSGSPTALLQALPAFERLQGKAPSDVADDWQLLVTRITALQRALDSAGVDPASYDPKHPPSSVTPTQRSAIRTAAAGVAAGDTQQALDALQQEVLDVCHTPLDL